MTEQRSFPWFLWPFAAIWGLLGFVLELVGRIVCAALGLVLMMLGGLIAMTVVGAWFGVPIALFGLMLMVRAIF